MPSLLRSFYFIPIFPANSAKPLAARRPKVPPATSYKCAPSSLLTSLLKTSIFLSNFFSPPNPPYPTGHPSSHAEKRAGRLEKTGWPTGRPAGQNRLADRLAGRPAARPDHSVECAGCSKSGSGGLFFPSFFAAGRKDALFLPPRGPPQPPPPRQRPRPLKPTTYRAPVPSAHNRQSSFCQRYEFQMTT